MKFSIVFGSLLVFSFFACSSKDDTPSSAEIIKKPASLSIETSEGYSWSFHFSYSGNLITNLSTGSGSSAEINYDSNGRLLYLQGSSGRTSYYYTNGNLSSKQFKDNRDYTRTTYYFYNDLDQISKSTTQESDREISYHYTYDSRGRLFERIDPHGNIDQYLYDDANNTFKNVYPKMGPKHDIGWVFPMNNNVVSHSQSASDDLRYEYIYDSDNYPILIKEIDSSGEIYTTTTVKYEE